MLQVKVQLRCRQHEKRDPTCPGCRHLAYFERRYDSMLTQRCRADRGDPPGAGSPGTDHHRPALNQGVPQGVLQTPLQPNENRRPV